MNACHQASTVRVGDYELLEELGSGGMGAVYRARQCSLDRPVALKILPQHMAHDREFVQRFMQEARAVAKLNHPNIVAGFDVGFADGRFFFAMEFAAGGSLGARIHAEGGLPEREAAAVGAAIARALAHAHAHEIVHRDVKPDNIILTLDGVPKLTDFGLARAERHDHVELTQSGRTVGTAHYMAPEQITGQKDVDGRADQYALGCTLYKAVTGKPPFDGGSSPEILYKHLRERMPSPRAVRHDLSEGFCAILHRMTARRKEDRYSCMAKVAEEFEALLSGRPNRTPSRSATKSCKTRHSHSGEHDRIGTRKHPAIGREAPWILAAAVAGLVAAIVGLASVLCASRERPPDTADPGALAAHPSMRSEPALVPVVQQEPAARSEKESAPIQKTAVFDGDFSHAGKGWITPGGRGASISLQKFKGRNGRAAVEFKGGGPGWMGAGWNWTGWNPSTPKADTRSYQTLRFSFRIVTARGGLPDVKIGLASPQAKAPAGMVGVRGLSPDALDGRWHDLKVSLDAFYRASKGEGYDPSQAYELVIHTWSERDHAFSILVDEIAFE